MDYSSDIINIERLELGGIVMEWFWYIIAAVGAGIGTGLAGLSAATVMVPMLIVLCPSVAGETGAYQATAPRELSRFSMAQMSMIFRKSRRRLKLTARVSSMVR